MKTFREWYQEEVLQEMALFKSPSGEGTWRVGNVELRGPDVYSILKKAGPEGLSVSELAEELVDSSEIRQFGSQDPFESLEAVAKKLGRDFDKVRNGLVGEIKNQLRKQKAVSQWKIQVNPEGFKWTLAPEAEASGATAVGRKKEVEALFEPASPAEAKASAPASKKSSKRGRGEDLEKVSE